jgi:hypothetical protein
MFSTHSAYRTTVQEVPIHGRMTSVDGYCCDDLRQHAEYEAPQHPDRADCPDVIIGRLADGRLGIPIHDGAAR